LDTNIILEAKELTKTYLKHGAAALDNVNIEIPLGRLVGLLGPNGSGKTTLIKIANGLLTPTTGELLIGGMKPSAETKKIVSYLPDRDILPGWMSVEKAVAYYADFFEDFRVDRAFEMIDQLGVSRKSKIKTLSKGNREKVSLILAMSREAKLYLLDEPLAGVDPAARSYILDTIVSNYSKEATVIISTHLIADVEGILDDVIFLKNGVIERYQSAAELRETEGKSVDEVFREVYRW
jgi:ABC-2 type transport system ATP-binding protein